ncbi:MAG: leucine-rich repeat domain-containing protein, partial [Clostridia bacterium]|nr:leucine-rich repeat domain-containing protein [Clostridia bacterium]
FANNRMLKEVTVMEGIEEVPEQCFYWTVNLEKVTLPESLVAIRERSFLGCDIKEVDIKNVTVIDTSAFAYCNKLEKVKSNSLLEKIGDEAFVGCSLLSEIDLSSVKILEGTPFLCCLSLKTVTLLSLEKWDGIKDNDADLETGRHHKKQPEGRHGGMVVYHGLSPMIKTPFRTCPSLETVTVKYPNNTTGEAFPSLFVDCPNLKSVTIENYQPNLSRWEFSNLTYDNRNGYVFVGTAKENTVIYCDDWAAEEYANLLGVKFSYLHDDMDKATSLWDDDYIMHIDNITGDKNVIIIDVTVTARNSEARKKLMDNPLWDFNIQYETENGWMHYGSLGYDILEGKATEYSQSYRLNYTISYKDNTRAYKKVMISSDKLTPFGEGCITISFDQIVDEVEIPLTRQWYEGGTLWISQVSLNAVVGVKGPTDKVMEDISGSIKFKFKDGSIKPCIEVYGKSSRSSLLIFGTDNPKMYEFKATANNNVVNLDEIESVIVNDVEYKLENYTQAE